MPWEQLAAMYQQNREAQRQVQATAPHACPIDGEPLDIRADGQRNCPMGNYRWPLDVASNG